MKRTIIIVISALVILGMAFGIMKFLAAQKELPAVKKAPELVRYVKTADVIYSDIETEVEGKGRALAVANVDVVAEGSGKILKGDIPLKTGQSFKKGDVLFSIYKDEVELALKARKSSFMNSIANLLPDIKIDYTEHYQTFHNFFKKIDVAEDLPEFPEITSDQLKIFLSSKNVLSEYYSIKKDELALKRYTVYAPFDGAYNTVNMEVGAYTNAGAKVAKAIRTDVVEVELAVNVNEADFIKVGDPVLLFNNDTISGKVVRIATYVDEGTQSRLIYAQVDRSMEMPLPGQYLKATFHGRELKHAMEIPRNAVFNSNEVYTIVEGRLTKKHIDVLKENEATLIFQGLDENAVLVVQPLIGVSDGTKVSRLRDAPKKGSQKGQQQKGNQPA